MTAQQHTDELAQLRAEVAALRARVDQPRRRFPRRVLPLALVALLVALLPLSLLAAGPVFSDLPTAAPVHQPNIQAIGDAGITTGFADPNNPNARLYNPKGQVIREEMASFLARTAGRGGNAPVVNAKTAQTAGQATNATIVGGYAPSGLARVGRGTEASGAITTSYQTVAQVVIVAPGPGFLLVSGHMTITPLTARCISRSSACATSRGRRASPAISAPPRSATPPPPATRPCG